jgi:hypothetical protein
MIKIGPAGLAAGLVTALVFALMVPVLAAAAPGETAAGAPEPPALLDHEEAVEALAGADAAPYEGADRLVLFDRTEIDVEDTGLGHVYHHRFVKVLNEEGALALRAERFDFDPASNMIEIIAVRVHREDSTFVDVDPSAAVDVAAPADYGIFWGGRMKLLALPPLEPGDGLEFITYKKGFQIAYLDEGGRQGAGAEGAGAAGGAEDDERFIPPMRGHFYDVVTFQGSLPMLEKTYVVRVPRDKLIQYSQYNGEVMSSLTFTDTHLEYTFWKEDIPAIEREPRMPDLTDVVPKVVMATVPSWPEKSRWFFETNEWVFESNPEIDRMVEDVTAGLKTDEEKIAALVHWVAQNIRYSGLSMGEGEGYTIHPSSMTFSDRCGVCKDIAGMLVTMLRSCGYNTYAAMTMAGARVEEVPADQFNHCVVALKQADGEYMMLDPTWAPWNNPVWSRWEGEQHYVIGSPDGEELTAIRAFAPEENLMAIRSQARILEDGTLEGTFTMEGQGISDGRLRGVRAYRPKADVDAYLEGWLGHISDRAELVSYSLSDHRDFTRNTTLRMEYRVPHFVDVFGGEMVFKSPGLLLVADNGAILRMAGFPDSEEREYPVFMWAPQSVTLDETISLPRHFKVESPEDWSMEESLASASLAWEAEGRRLNLNAEASLDSRVVPLDDYAGVRDVVTELKEEADNQLYAVR